MADNEIASLSIGIDTSGLDAGSAKINKIERDLDAASAALARFEAANARTFAKMGAAAGGLAGVGGSSSAGLSAGVDAAAKLTQGLDGATAAATRLEAIMGKLAASNAATFAKINPAMLGTAGPSPVGGSAANPFGPAWQQSMAGATQGYVGLTRAAEGAASVTERMAAANSAASAKLAAATGVTAADVAARFAHVQASSAMAEAEDVLAGRFGNTTRALGTSAAAHHAHGGAVYGNQLQMMELAHVGRALFDEMMAGGNVLRGLAMEFGRLQIAVTSGEGGITGMLGRVAGFAGRLANPMALATGSIAAFGTAAAVSFERYEAGQEGLERALNLRGRYSGLTLDDANRLAASSAERGGLSFHEGTSLAATYLGAGLNRDATASAIELSHDFSRVTGKGLDESGKFLAGALGDPSRGLGELGQLLGGVDDKLKAQIDTLERSGHIYEAQALELSFINRAMHEASESTFSFSRSLGGAWNWISDRFSDFGHGVASSLGYGGDEENLRRNKEQLRQLSTFDPEGNAPAIAALNQEIARLEASIGKASADAARREADGRAIQLSGRAGDAVRTLLPEIMRQRSAADTTELLRSALADPLVMGHLDPSISPALLGRAYSQANVLEAMNRPGMRERQDYELGLSRTRDWGTQDQGLNSARQAELGVLRETGDVIRALTAAQRSLNLEISKANEQADDRLRQAQQESSLVGLSPYDRAKKQLRDEYFGDRGIIERDRFDRGGANVFNDKDIAADLRGGYAILSAGQDAAGKLTAAGGHLVGAVDTLAAKIDAAAGRIGPAEAAARLPWSGGMPSAFLPNARGVPLSAGFESSVERTLGFEGGLLPRDTNGTVTNFGINSASHPGVDVEHLTRDQAKGIYQREYWQPLGLDAANPAMQRVAFDTGVMEGVTQARKLMAESGGDAGKLLDLRQGYEQGLMQKDPGKYGPFAKSWALRDASLRADIAGGMGPAAAASIPLPPERPAELGGLSATSVAAAPILNVSSRDATVAPIAPTAEDRDRKTFATRDASVDKSYASFAPLQFGTPIGDANRRLQEQNASLALQYSMFGKSAEATKGAVAAQDLWSHYLDSGVTKTAKLSEATGSLADAVRDYGVRAQEAADRADKLAKAQAGIVEASDFARGGLSSVLSGGLLSAVHGQGFGAGARSAVASFGESLLNKSVSGGINFLTGGAGNPLGFGSLLGDLSGFSGLSHFAGGTPDAPGGPTIVGESGPELIDAPRGASIYTADQTSAMRAGGGGPPVNIHLGDLHVHPVGGAQFSNDQLRLMTEQHAQKQQETVQFIQRNLKTIARNNGMYND